MPEKPSLPKGTRDFGPKQMFRRNYILNIIKEVFIKFGFSQIETPSMENLSVLTGKYGEEGDQLLFKILNSGNFLSKTHESERASSQDLVSKISEKGLRYDLTVPFARYVVMNQNDIIFPFKRFQIQPVWRADRPQKGRYREFYQCDADVVGTESLICEADIVLMIREVFAKLAIVNYTIKLNNRKILEALAQISGKPDMKEEFYVAIDKLDKIGEEKVVQKLLNSGFSENAIKKLLPIFNLQGGWTEKMIKIENLISQSETGNRGLLELKQVLQYLHDYNVSLDKLDFDPTLARGLTYYTGTIFEVKVNNVKLGSVSGGGRYSNLTAAFGLQGESGVGISFGIDRIYDALEELKLFPDDQPQSTQILITNFNRKTQAKSLPILKQLRDAGIAAEIYPDTVKMKKQMNYADKRGISYVLLIGDQEIEKEEYSLKNMKTGNQQPFKIEELIAKLS